MDGLPAPADGNVIPRALTFSDRFDYSRNQPLEVFAVGSEIYGQKSLNCIVDDIHIYSLVHSKQSLLKSSLVFHLPRNI